MKNNAGGDTPWHVALGPSYSFPGGALLMAAARAVVSTLCGRYVKIVVI